MADPKDAEPCPTLVLARKDLKRSDLSLECSGQQQWIETTGARKKIWLILQTSDGKLSFEEI